MDTITKNNCPYCQSENCRKLWQSTVVRPGDNSDNAVQAERWGCPDCDKTWLQRIANILASQSRAQTPEEKNLSDSFYLKQFED